MILNMVRSETQEGKWHKVDIPWSAVRRKEMVTWCKTNGTQGRFYAAVSWYSFENDADAMLFILRWL